MRRVRFTVAFAIALGLALREGALASAHDLGPGEPLCKSELRKHMVENDIMAEYVARHGEPDWAELQRVAVDPPLFPYEIRIFYLGEGVAASFTRARLVGGMEVSIKRWEHPLDASKRAFILDELIRRDPVRRAEAAADRAEAAADRIDVAADVAEAAAQKASRVVAEMEARSSDGAFWH